MRENPKDLTFVEMERRRSRRLGGGASRGARHFGGAVPAWGGRSGALTQRRSAAAREAPANLGEAGGWTHPHPLPGHRRKRTIRWSLQQTNGPIPARGASAMERSFLARFFWALVGVAVFALFLVDKAGRPMDPYLLLVAESFDFHGTGRSRRLVEQDLRDGRARTSPAPLRLRYHRDSRGSRDRGRREEARSDFATLARCGGPGPALCDCIEGHGMRRRGMKRQLVRTWFMGPAIAGVVGGFAAGPGADTASAQDRCELPRQVVVGEPGHQVVFERERRQEGRSGSRRAALADAAQVGSQPDPPGTRNGRARDPLARVEPRRVPRGIRRHRHVQRDLVLPRVPGGTTIQGRPRIRQADRRRECRRK